MLKCNGIAGDCVQPTLEESRELQPSILRGPGVTGVTSGWAVELGTDSIMDEMPLKLGFSGVGVQQGLLGEDTAHQQRTVQPNVIICFPRRTNWSKIR